MEIKGVLRVYERWKVSQPEELEADQISRMAVVL